MKKQKKTGSVAIPFLITLLISLAVIGGIATYIYSKIEKDDASLVSMVQEVRDITDEDSHTILFAVDMSDTIASDSDDYYSEEETQEDGWDEWGSEQEEWDQWEDEEETEAEDESEQSKDTYVQQPYTFMLMRSEPVNKKILFMGIPSNILVGKNNKQAQDVYINNGTSALASSIEFSFGINVDRYMTLDTEGFKKVCNVLGGVKNFGIPGCVNTDAPTDSEQYLSTEQIIDIVSCGNYPGGELDRISTVSALVTAMVNQTSGARIAGNLDNTFDNIIKIADTNISASDYKDRKYAIKFMLEYSDSEDSEKPAERAFFETVYGEEDGSDFVADKYFAEDIQVYFEPVKEETPAEETTDKKTDGETSEVAEDETTAEDGEEEENKEENE